MSSTTPARAIDSVDETFAQVGEFLRRGSLGLTAMLFVARAYFPSEDASTGTGLTWVLAMLAVVAVAIASSLFTAKLQFRWSWADLAVLALVVLVAMSAWRAADRRPAITMAWEWGSLGFLYFLFRNLPRSRGESVALAGIMVATAVALSTYGLYQVSVEFDQLRDLFHRRPDLVIQQLGMEPNAASLQAIKQRLVDSNEVYSTFALPNSLAGFLVGAMALAFAVGLDNLKREGRGSRLVALALASVPGLIMLICLVLTKSRSAWIGLFVALLVLAWRARRALPIRVLAYSGISLAVLVGVLIVGGVATKHLDIQVLTEAPKSLKYRWEYWVGTWGVITDAPPLGAFQSQAALPGAIPEAEPTRRTGTFWSGLGPANFATPYLGQKLPQASEEILDPHNMILEVWATAGVFAMLGLVVALVVGLREILGPGAPAVDPDLEATIPPAKPVPGHRTGSGSAWLILMASLGWLAVWTLGKLDPIGQRDSLSRWILLGAGWWLAIAFGFLLWRRRPIPAVGLGVGVLAMAINLLAAGGIGIPSVAMALWGLLAVGLNLRDDRACGRLREVRGLGLPILLACIWSGLTGTFYGANMPFWESESDRAAGNAAMAARPPAYELARNYYTRAITADSYNVRPWLSLADLEYAYWRSPENTNKKEPGWMKVNLALDKALDENTRNPWNLNLRRRQADYARAILNDLPADSNPWELLGLRITIVKACRWKTRIYPTNAAFRVELAQASAEIGMFQDAVQEAKQAIRLDEITPHLDKMLPAAIRDELKVQIPLWEKKAKEPPPKAPASPSASKVQPR